MQKGDALLQEKQFEKASKLYSQALKADSSNNSAKEKLSECEERISLQKEQEEQKEHLADLYYQIVWLLKDNLTQEAIFNGIKGWGKPGNKSRLSLQTLLKTLRQCIEMVGGKAGEEMTAALEAAFQKGWDDVIAQLKKKEENEALQRILAHKAQIFLIYDFGQSTE